MEFSLTQVLPVKGRLAQELREASHIPEAQVGSLTRQRMDAMGCIPANTNMPPPVFKQAQAAACERTHSAASKQNTENSVNTAAAASIKTVLPDEGDAVPDVLGCVAHAQGEHDPRFGSDPGHARGQLPGRTCGRHDGGQGAAEQRASRLNQLRLVLITPLSTDRHTDRDMLTGEPKKCPEERKQTPCLLSGQRN